LWNQQKLVYQLWGSSSITFFKKDGFFFRIVQALVIWLPFVLCLKMLK